MPPELFFKVYMSFILSGLLSLLSGLPTAFGEYFKKKQEIEKAKLDNELQLELERQKYIAQEAASSSDRAKASLKATSPLFKYCVFIMLSSPFAACLIGYNDYANSVFANLEHLPQWYLILYTSIIAVIWGIPVQGNITSMIVDGLKTATANRREFKLAKIDRKAYYDALRLKQGYVSGDDVAKQEKVFDAMEANK